MANFTIISSSYGENIKYSTTLGILQRDLGQNEKAPKTLVDTDFIEVELIEHDKRKQYLKAFGGALAGAVLAGGVGAIVGGLAIGNKNDYLIAVTLINGEKMLCCTSPDIYKKIQTGVYKNKTQKFAHPLSVIDPREKDENYLDNKVKQMEEEHKESIALSKKIFKIAGIAFAAICVFVVGLGISKSFSNDEETQNIERNLIKIGKVNSSMYFYDEKSIKRNGDSVRFDLISNEETEGTSALSDVAVNCKTKEVTTYAIRFYEKENATGKVENGPKFEPKTTQVFPNSPVDVARQSVCK